MRQKYKPLEEQELQLLAEKIAEAQKSKAAYEKIIEDAKSKIKEHIKTCDHSFSSGVRLVVSTRELLTLKEDAVDILRKDESIQKYIQKILYEKTAIKEDVLNTLLEADKISPTLVRSLYNSKESKVLSIKYEKDKEK